MFWKILFITYLVSIVLGILAFVIIYLDIYDIYKKEYTVKSSAKSSAVKIVSCFLKQALLCIIPGYNLLVFYGTVLGGWCSDEKIRLLMDNNPLVVRKDATNNEEDI